MNIACELCNGDTFVVQKVLIDVFSASPFFDGASVRLVLKVEGKCTHIKLVNQTYIHTGNTVLDLSAGLIKSGIELAGDYGENVLLTGTDSSRLERAEELATKLVPWIKSQ